MKYLNRTITTIAFERSDMERYKAAALRMGLDFNAWVVAQCERTCKRDNRINKNRAKSAKGE